MTSHCPGVNVMLRIFVIPLLVRGFPDLFSATIPAYERLIDVVIGQVLGGVDVIESGRVRP
jgi:hypothetical protein